MGLPLEHSVEDESIVAAQLGRPLRGRWAVARRCHLGVPMVIENHPRLEDGSPFPTLFWLTCPLLAKRVSRLEGGGRMAELNRRLDTDAALRVRVGAALQRLVERRDSHEAIDDSGAPPGGGPEKVKCLHAHVAHELVDPPNPLGALRAGGDRLARLRCTLRRSRFVVRVAAIDVGTNSTRLLVAESIAGGFRSIERRMVITRLGEGVHERRILAPEALQRTLATIADYAATCGELSVERIRVTGTSAVRDARNRDEFFSGVRLLTGADAELLTGEQEARATFLGTLSDLHETGPVMVVDIGGGSTEFIVGQEEPERLASLDFGCVRMFEKHLHSDPPAKEEIAALREEVTGEIEAIKDDLDVPPGARAIGVAGTVTQLATLRTGLPVYDPDVTHHFVLSHGDVRQLARRLESLTYDQRIRTKALEPGRADVIVAGAEILLCVMETFDTAEILVSEKDILDGLVIQLLNE